MDTKTYILNPSIDISTIGVYKIILSWIQPGSTILECGSASGYLTKYLNEQLKCKVSIVEIDRTSFEAAKQYADLSYNGDLNTKQWFNYYNNRGKKFDYILFIEVLEHLRKPVQALQLASQLLKDDGKIIFSVPNVCHTDILIRMFYNQFNYTEQGLLDNTHIHFFGLQNLPMLIDQSNLQSIETQMTVAPIHTTEQAMPIKNIDPLLLRALEHRPHGNAYQFICLCKKKDSTGDYD